MNSVLAVDVTSHLRDRGVVVEGAIAVSAGVLAVVDQGVDAAGADAYERRLSLVLGVLSLIATAKPHERQRLSPLAELICCPLPPLGALRFVLAAADGPALQFVMMTWWEARLAGATFTFEVVPEALEEFLQ